MADAFQLLADPTRRRLLELTASMERNVGGLVKATGLSQPAVSKQLGILRRGGLVEVRQQGTHRFYRARPDRLKGMRVWLETVGVQWDVALDALEDHLETM